MVRPARAAGPHIDPARIRLRVGDEFADVLGRKRWIDRHEVGKASDARDRRDVTHEIEAKIFVVGRVDRIRGVDQQQGVAVRRGTHHCLGGDIGRGPGAVLHHELLLEQL